MNKQLIKEQIIRDFGIDIEKVEDSVYKVLNTNKELNVDNLQLALGNCVVIASDNISYEKDKDGTEVIIARIYYIVIVYNIELGYTYYYKAKEQFESALYLDYKEDTNDIESIDTLYLREDI